MFHRKPRRVRLMTAENLRLSRPEPQPERRARGYGGILIESAEGTRFAYASTPISGVEGGSIVPQKVEGARMAAAMILGAEVELPLTPLPEPGIEPREE
jgi:hypothetical protein